MRHVPLALAFALALSLPGLAGAHGIVFSADPTAFNLDGYLAADKTIQLTTGAAAKVFFAAIQPGTDATPLAFALKAPLKFTPHGAEFQIPLYAAKPVLTQDTNGNSIRVELLADGRPIEGAKVEKALPLKLGPDEPSGIQGSFATNVTEPIAENATITLRLTPLMPVLVDQGLAVVVGGDSGATLNFPLIQVPTVQDLHLQDTDLYQYDISRGNFTPADNTQAVNEIDVYHADVTTNYVNVFGTKAYFVFKGAEPSNDAQEYHMFVDRERRMNSTHDFLLGTTLVRVYPGLGVVVDADLSSGPTVLKCVKHCPANGFQMTIQPYRINQKPGDPGAPVGGPAIPTVPTGGGSASPPPSAAATSTPPTQKQAPGAPIVVSLAGALALALALGRRRG